MAKELNEDTGFKVSIKTLVGIGVAIATVVGMWFALQADIQEAKDLPKNEWNPEWLEKLPPPSITKQLFSGAFCVSVLFHTLEFGNFSDFI